MINVYKWATKIEGKKQQMIAVGKDAKSAKVYSVHKGYRMLEEDKFVKYLGGFSVLTFDTEKTTYAKIQKEYGPVKTNLYRFQHFNYGQMIAVGNDSLFAKVYSVEKGYRFPIEATLGQLIKFNAIDPEDFKEPKFVLLSDIEKKYGPVKKQRKKP